MLPYWIFFLVPAMVAVVSSPRMKLRYDGTRAKSIDALWVIVLLMLTIIIGFRYEVGGDWGNYFRYLLASAQLDLSDLVTLGDPGYWFLNIMSVRAGFEITGVNIAGGVIFSTGLVLFCRSLPRPWLALACAMPYLVVVVAMGYTRQSIALGLCLIGFLALGRQHYTKFLIWVLIGALFHKSAVLLLPIAGLTVSKNRFVSICVIALATAVGYFTLLADSANYLVETYTDRTIQSSGAVVRLAMNAVPAALFLRFERQFSMAPSEKALWTLLSWVSLGMFVAFFFTGLSTALDRMALYCLPLQLVVFAHFPDAIGRYGGRNQTIVAGIVMYYAVVLFVWLNFANHAHLWLPYGMGVDSSQVF